MGYNLLINGVYWGYNLLTNLLLTSWDIQVAFGLPIRIPKHPQYHGYTLAETNSKFAPENGWLEYDPFLLGFGLFSGALAVSFREGILGGFLVGQVSGPKKVSEVYGIFAVG